MSEDNRSDRKENQFSSMTNSVFLSGIDSEIINSIIKQKILNNLLLINNVLTKIDERKISNEGLIKEIIALENLIIVQLHIFNHKFHYGFNVPLNLKGVLESELFTTKREKVKIKENTVRDIALLEKELRQLWKEVFDLLNQLNLLSNGSRHH